MVRFLAAAALVATVSVASLLGGCAGACYQEDRNADGTWPARCADRITQPNPTRGK